MKEAVTRGLNTLTQKDFQGAFQKLLERYNKFIDVEGEYFEGDLSFLCVRLIKVSTQKQSGNLLNAPRKSPMMIVCDDFLRIFKMGDRVFIKSKLSRLSFDGDRYIVPIVMVSLLLNRISTNSVSQIFSFIMVGSSRMQNDKF